MKKRKVSSGIDDPRAQAALQAQLEAFEKKFGREPGPDDPLMFDPDLDVPTPLAKQKMLDLMINAMAKVGIQPALIWGYIKTGLIYAEINQHLMTNEMKHDWQEAMREFREDRPDIKSHIEAAKARLAANAYYECIQ